jgi:hypothetical protein
MSSLTYYNFDDFQYLIRKDGSRSKQYKYWCQSCQKDRGYGFRNKIMKESLCHPCKMKSPEVLAKISRAGTGRICSDENKAKKSAAMYRLYNSNPQNRKISRNLRSRLNKAIAHSWKSGSAVADLGCSIDELKAHLESQFTEGMTWETYGRDGWHIDHIVPLCRFDLSSKDEIIIACCYSNLQPLWARDNLKKRKVDGTFRKE